MARGMLTRAALWTLGVVGVVVLAAFVAGPLHRTVVAWGWQGKDDFASTFRHVAIFGLVLLIALGARPWRDAPKGAWGLWGSGARPAWFVPGVALALALLGALVLFEALEGWIAWERRGGAKLASRWPAAVAGALAVGLLEEVFFRGWVLSRFRRRLAPFAAALATSVVYAVPHGFKGSAAAKGLSADASGALEVVRSWGVYVSDLSVFGPKVVGFTAFGLLLAAAFYRARTLWFGVGIHAGAVFALTVANALSEPREPPAGPPFWAGSKFLHDGAPAWLLMAAVAFLLWPRGGTGPEGPARGEGA